MEDASNKCETERPESSRFLHPQFPSYQIAFYRKVSTFLYQSPQLHSQRMPTAITLLRSFNQPPPLPFRPMKGKIFIVRVLPYSLLVSLKSVYTVVNVPFVKLS